MTMNETQGSAQAEAPTFANLFPIPDEARRLERFLGTWNVSGALTAEGTVMPMSGQWQFSPAAAGWGVASELRAEVEGMGVYEEYDLVGFDAETGLFHVYSLTNSGAVHDHVARWSTADRFEFEYTGLQGGQPYREVGTVEILADGGIRVTSEDFVNGEIATSMEARLDRR
jgi:hypothetical protein